MGLASQGVEQVALTRVRRTDQDHAGTSIRAVPPLETFGQGGNLVGGSAQFLGQGGAGERIDILLVHEIQPGFHVGQHVEQAVPQPLDRSREAARQLPKGRVELRPAVRIDDAEHRLGPRQVDPPVEERPQGELPRLGQPGSGGQQVGQQQVQ